MKYVAAALLVLGLVIGAWQATDDRDRHPTAPPDPWHRLYTTSGGVRIHAIRLGQVQIKRPHREWNGPAGLRFPAIIGSARWHEWMPVLVYLVEHPDEEGLLLVDAGVARGMALDPAQYFACDPEAAWFYQRNLRFHVEDGLVEESLTGRMAALGLDPARVSDVLITHMHADHTGHLPDLPQARVWMGPGNWPSHVGSARCTLPEGLEPDIIAWDEAPVGPFLWSSSWSADGAVRLVPLPGHTPGHAGVWIEDRDGPFILAGDATFDPEQTARGGVTGAAEDMGLSRATQRLLQEAVSERGARILAAHDPAILGSGPSALRGAPAP